MITDDFRDRLQVVQLLIVDVDGVLTDGGIIYGDYGDEIKRFDVQDGLGIVLLHRAGIKTVIITAKKSRNNDRRAKDMHVTKIYQNVKDKLKVYEKILKKFKLHGNQVCFMGDDLIDMPVFSRVGCAVAVQNARNEIKEKSHYVTQSSGGRGAVRELADLLLKTQGKWDQVTGKYFQ